jgi:multiple antibiotic resistance protein
VDYTIRAFTTLFFAIDPVGLVPTVMALLVKHSPQEQERIMRRAILIAGALLLVTIITGTLLSGALHRATNVLSVFAGVFFVKVAVDTFKESRAPSQPQRSRSSRWDVALFPLAVPLITGPGVLTSVLVLSHEATGSRGELVLVSLVLLSITFWLFKLGARLLERLPRRLARVAPHLSALGCLAFGAQFLWHGLHGVLEAR